MKNLTKKINLLVILFVILLSAQSCTMYGQPNNGVRPSNDYATIAAATTAAKYVKFYGIAKEDEDHICCVDGDGDGRADLKDGYGYSYTSPAIQLYWFKKPGYIISAILCDGNGNTLTVNGVDATVDVKVGTTTGIISGDSNIYQFKVNNASTFVLAMNVNKNGTYYADNSNATHLYLVNF